MHPKNKADTLKEMDSRLLPLVERERDQTRKLAGMRKEMGYTSAQIYEMVHYSYPEKGPHMAALHEGVCPGPKGDLRVRLYYPFIADSPLPVILFLHGGGFVVGSINTHDGIMRCLARDTGAVVVGFNYSLAPTYKFPTPLEETIAVMEWLQERRVFYHLNTSDMTLAGDSAGAHIALGTYLYLRDNSHPQVGDVNALLLYYGFFGLKDSFTARCYGGWWDGLSRGDMNRYLSCYTNTDRDSPYFNLFSNDLSRDIPPTYLLGCGLDPLLDDSRTLHRILTGHNLAVRLKVLPKMIHACLYYFNEIPEVRSAIGESASYWKDYRLSGKL